MNFCPREFDESKIFGVATHVFKIMKQKMESSQYMITVTSQIILFRLPWQTYMKFKFCLYLTLFENN